MRTLYTLLGGFAIFAVSLSGQAAKPAVPTPAPQAAAKEIVLTGTTVNVKESGTPVSIRLFRWSTDEERAALVAAFTGRAGGGRATPPTGQDQPQRGQGQGRAQGQALAPPPNPDEDDSDAPRPQGRGQAQGRQGQGAQGQAGQRQGGGRAARGAPPATPALSPFMQAIQRAPNLGYLFTSEPTGYSVKHAWRTSQPDGSERVVIITEPRLGAYSPTWAMKSGTPTDYGFTLLEFRIDPKTAEGKSSLTSKVVV